MSDIYLWAMLSLNFHTPILNLKYLLEVDFWCSFLLLILIEGLYTSRFFSGFSITNSFKFRKYLFETQSTQSSKTKSNFLCGVFCESIRKELLHVVNEKQRTNLAECFSLDYLRKDDWYWTWKRGKNCWLENLVPLQKNNNIESIKKVIKIFSQKIMLSMKIFRQFNFQVQSCAED